MSGRNEEAVLPKTVAQKVLEVIEATPPPATRKARKAHISKDDFAKLIGAGRQPLYNWLNGSAFPDDMNRERLAAAATAVQIDYTADDFKGPTEEEREDRLAALEEAVGGLLAELDLARQLNQKLTKRVGALEAAARRTQREGLASAAGEP